MTYVREVVKCFHPDRNAYAVIDIFLPRPWCAWLTLFHRCGKYQAASCSFIHAPICICSWNNCSPDFKTWVPRVLLDAFLLSSSDADHILSMKTEVWPWHLCKHIWLVCFLISDCKHGLPNPGACLWRGSLIKVSIQSCTAKHLPLLDYLLKACNSVSFQHPHLAKQKRLCQVAAENESSMRKALWQNFSSLLSLHKNDVF